MTRLFLQLRSNFKRNISTSLVLNRVTPKVRSKKPAAISTSIDRLRATLREDSEVPLCTGVIPLDAKISQLFYRNAADGSLGFIDFSTAVSDDQLEHLAQACQPATFGVQQQDVLDESYRKARKMDTVNFSTNFNPTNTGIMQGIQGLLLKNPESPIRVELHKLNVYGPGSFFKSHVDTPKSSKMFGSLVVVLPTKHDGGTFPLRHHGREWVFNSADMVSPQNSESPRAAFVAFFGDIEHEVSVVKSGYRVSLAYNLYFGDDKSITAPSTMSPIDDSDDMEVKIKESLIALLNNSKFLSRGGILGIPLSYQYPIGNKDINLDELGKSLKGTDAAIKRACDSLSLEASIKTVYNSKEVDGVACLFDTFPDPGEGQIEDDIALHLREESESRGLLVFDSDKSLKNVRVDQWGPGYESYKGAKPILWLRPLAKRNKFEQAYVRYGNEATLAYVYGEICLVVKVEASKDRKTY